MALEVTVELAAYPKGEPLAFNGLGIIENGKTKTLTDEEELAFVSAQGKSVRDAFEGQEGITVKGRGKYSDADLPEVSDTAPIEPESEDN